MKKRNSIVIAGFCLWSFISCLGSASAQTGDSWSMFGKANSLYRQAQYDESISVYDEIVRQGHENAAVYYNIGNCYFKKGQLGLAVLNYERARLYAPGDNDVKANYQYARSLLGIEDQHAAGTAVDRVLDAIFEAVTINALTGICVCLWWLICGVIVAGLFISPVKRYSVKISIVLGIVLVICALGVGRKIVYVDRGAIVTKKQQDARFEPNESATVFFTLQEGSFVEVLESSQSWRKIRRSDGKIGWVSASSVEPIVPVR